MKCDIYCINITNSNNYKLNIYSSLCERVITACTPINFTGVAEGRPITPWKDQESNILEGRELVNERK